MPKQRNILQIITNAAIFIIMEIAALSMLSNNNGMQRFFLAKRTHALMANLWGGSENIKNYFLLQKTNDELARENFQLKQKIRQFVKQAEMDSLQHELNNMGNITQVGDFEFMPANIVKVSRNKQHNYIILGQGSEDGVKESSGIITDNGIVGIVDAVSKHYSYAISFMNSDFSVSSRIGDAGAIGPLVWDGVHSDGAILKEIPLQYKFHEGDTVFTSGHSSIFPPDIALGTIQGSKIVNGATYELEVKLFRNVGSTRYVTLVNNIGKEEIENLEKQKDS